MLYEILDHRKTKEYYQNCYYNKWPFSFYRIEEAKRAIKRSAPATTDTDRYGDVDRKRSAPERRFEPPPPPRFDTAIRSTAYDRPPPEKKRIDDYPSNSSSKRGNDDYKSSRSTGVSSEISTFKRPLNEYPKRDHDVPSRSSGYDGPRGISSINSSSKDHRFNDSVDSRSTSFGRNRTDDRDSRYVVLIDWLND